MAGPADACPHSRTGPAISCRANSPKDPRVKPGDDVLRYFRMTKPAFSNTALAASLFKYSR
jgi:hypothetical protein